MFNQFAQYEDAFRDWRRDGMPGLKAESYKYIEFLTSPDDDQARGLERFGRTSGNRSCGWSMPTRFSAKRR